MYQWEDMLKELKCGEETCREMRSRIDSMEKLVNRQRDEARSMYNLTWLSSRPTVLEEINAMLIQAEDSMHFKGKDPRGTVLILADRLFGEAVGLAYYLTLYTELDVMGVAHSYESAARIVGERAVDLLIVAGMQEDLGNYRVSYFLKERDHTNVMMWAFTDCAARTTCKTYDIPYICNRFYPLVTVPQFITLCSLTERTPPRERRFSRPRRRPAW